MTDYWKDRTKAPTDYTADCPFCGEHMNIHIRPEPGDPRYVRVRCKMCQATGPIETTEDAAVQGWNCRAIEAGWTDHDEVVRLRRRLERVEGELFCWQTGMLPRKAEDPA